ncbi:hypothetical protein [Nocardia sp. NPDC059228]|uniref:hypothetical protein n=1 Tax=Nocardia sp. NPDC059228 TaxID=3346777 RepID=UPI0036B6B7C7
MRWPSLRVRRAGWRRIAIVAAVNTGLTMMTFTLITFVVSNRLNTRHCGAARSAPQCCDESG